MSSLKDLEPKLKVVHQKVIAFLLTNGPSSIYDLAEGVLNKRTGLRNVDKGIHKKYSTCHKIIEEMEKNSLVKSTKIKVGRNKRIVRLTGRALILSILLVNEEELFWSFSDAIRRNEKIIDIKNILENHEDFFFFISHWENFCNLLGENKVIQKLILTANKLIYGKNIEFKIDDSDIKFEGFYYEFRRGIHQHHNISTVGKNRNHAIQKLIIENDELKKSYISFLALHDVWDLALGNKDIDATEELIAEREYSIIKKVSLTEKRVFDSKNLKMIFPKYAKMKYIFAGLFLYNLLWESKSKRPQIKTKNNFQGNYSGFIINGKDKE